MHLQPSVKRRQGDPWGWVREIQEQRVTPFKKVNSARCIYKIAAVGCETLECDPAQPETPDWLLQEKNIRLIKKGIHSALMEPTISLEDVFSELDESLDDVDADE